MTRGDSSGLWWHEEPPPGRSVGTAPLPPLPEKTEWQLPEGPDSYPSLAGQGAIAIDIETYDPELKSRGPGVRRDGKIVGVAVGTEAGFRQYYPIDHQGWPNLPKEVVWPWLQEQLLLEVPKIGANLLYDLDYLEAAGVKVAGPFYDVQVAEPLLDETRLSYSLETLAQHYLSIGKFEDVMARWLKKAFKDESNIKNNIWRAPPAVVGPYAEGDVDLPLRIFAQQRTALEQRGLWNLFIMESKLIPMLLAMRQRGVPVDLQRAEQLRDDLKQRQTTALAEIKRLSGRDVDIWAADSVAKLFDSVEVIYPRTEKTNAPSFRREWLEACAHPVAKLLVEARKVDKFRNTFVEGGILEGAVNGRIHTQFHQLRGDGYGTVSGRFSSSAPNLQNQPIRDPELGKLIRQIFVAEQGQQWWKFDWSQIEFRLAVHYASRLCLPGIEKVVEQYKNDPSTDYHKVVADLTGLPRYQAKSINFGFVYGMGVMTLCDQMGISFQESEAILNKYHKEVPFVKPLYNAASNRAAVQGQIQTIGGRIRHFNVWTNDGDRYVQERELREQGILVYNENTGRAYAPGWRRAYIHKALNALLQGSAADIMKMGMVNIWESGVGSVLGAPHLTVHDELDGSVPPGKEGQEALAEIKNIMETCTPIAIPMRADGGLGSNWGDCKE